MTFEKELEQLINRHSMEGTSGTPDFILARFLDDCLKAWNTGQKAREQWYGRPVNPIGVARQWEEGQREIGCANPVGYDTAIDKQRELENPQRFTGRCDGENQSAAVVTSNPVETWDRNSAVQKIEGQQAHISALAELLAERGEMIVRLTERLKAHGL